MVPHGKPVSEEIEWRSYLILGTLMHCRAVARLSAEDLAEVEALLGGSLRDAAETGRALLELSDPDLAALAEHIDNPWDHPAMRTAVATLRRDGIKAARAMALRAALLRHVRRNLNGH
jgi:hypothetical protein